jgi:hypothetical protein
VASSGIQVSGTGIVIDAAGVVVTGPGNGDTCCCGGTDYTCDNCGGCCWSSISRLTVSWGPPTSTITSTGDGAVAWQSHSETMDSLGLLTSGGSSFYRWGVVDFNLLLVFIDCTTGAWTIDSLVPPGATAPASWPDHYRVVIDSDASLGPITGDCTTLVDVSARLRVWHMPSGSGEYDPNSQATGFFSGNVPLTITITDNQCCHDLDSHLCVKGDSDADGDCLSSP